jgi:microcystin-dependent protein
MATTNKVLNQPAIGSTGWGTPLNDNFGYIDGAFGGVTNINVTGVTATPVVLSAAQYRNLIIKFSGTLTANVTYQLPSGIGGKWVIRNSATGAFTVTFASLGGGTSYVASGGFSNAVSDGVNAAGNFDAIASGVITMWSGSIVSIPTGWFLCDGTNGTPDLRDRFIVGAASTYAVAATGGAATVTLTQAETPSHTHGYGPVNTSSNGLHDHSINDPGHVHSYNTTVAGNSPAGAGVGSTSTSVQTSSAQALIGTISAGTHTHLYSGATNLVGGSESHENRPPYLALCYIRKA